MKTKIKRHSRSVLSVVLTLCMLVSCITVGLITTDAAQVDSEAVGTIDSWYFASYPSYAGNDWDNVKMFDGATGSYTLDRGSGASTITLYFKVGAEENGSRYWCGSGDVTLGTEKSLTWNQGWDNSELNVVVTKRYVTFTMASGNKLTVTESDYSDSIEIVYGFNGDTHEAGSVVLVPSASDANIYESPTNETVTVSGNFYIRPKHGSSYPWQGSSQSDTSKVKVDYESDYWDNAGARQNGNVPGYAFYYMHTSSAGDDLPYSFKYDVSQKKVYVECAAAVNLTVDSISDATAAYVTVGSTTVNAGSNGTVTPRQQATITVTPTDSNKKISKAYYNGTAVKMVSNHNGTYSGTFTVPNEATTVTFDPLTDKSSYKVKVAVNDPSYGTAAITSAGDGAYSESATYTEDTPIVLSATAAGADHPFHAWDKGTDKTHASATYYVDGDDCDVGDPSTPRPLPLQLFSKRTITRRMRRFSATLIMCIRAFQPDSLTTIMTRKSRTAG